jgi:hypothetical protein
MRRAGWVLAAVVAAAAAAVVVQTPRPASAVSGLQSGYWWQAQPDGAPLPPPPQVPANGLWVSGTPDAQQAVSAVRFDLADNEANPVLTLKVHSKNPPEDLTAAANAGVAVVIACPVTKAWTPASAGAWSSRPEGRCEAAVHGTLNADATTVAFDLSAVVADGKVDVVLVPGAGGGATLPNPPAIPGAPAPPQPSGGFDLTFEPAAADQIVVSPGGAAPAPAAPEAAPAEPSPVSADLGSSVAPAPDFNFAATSVNPGAGTAAAPAPSAASGSVAPQLRQLPTADVRENHGYRALAVIVLAALLWWAWRQAVPPRPDRRTIYDGPPA